MRNNNKKNQNNNTNNKKDNSNNKENDLVRVGTKTIISIIRSIQI